MKKSNIKKTILILSTGVCFTSLLACVGSVKKVSMNELPQEHRWNESEIRILESLSLHNFTPKHDNSNRVVDNPDAAKLGEALFFDTRFSINGKVACASCHKPELYFTDGLAQAVGISKTKRNAPTIVGVSNNTWFFLDGRTDSLWSQALQPIENEFEHGSSRGQVAHVIYNDAGLRKQYEKVFGSIPDVSDISRFPKNAGPTSKKSVEDAWQKMENKDQQVITEIFVNFGKAIAAYETSLQPSPSRFDDYVKAISEGNAAKMQSLLSKDEVAGLKVFLGKGNCFICHNGPLFTDLEFHNIAAPPLDVKRYDYGRKKAVHRVKRDPFNCRSEYNDAKEKPCDELKYMVIHEEETTAAFKTPSLRNVSKTAPYMHAGQYNTLSEVIKHYNDPPSTKVGMSQLFDIDLTDLEMKQLETFLKALNSDIK